MMNTKTLNDKQRSKLKAIIAYFKGRTRVTRQELREAHFAVAEKVGTPDFISHNEACKVMLDGKPIHGLYNLAVFASSLRAGSKKAAA